MLNIADGSPVLHGYAWSWAKLQQAGLGEACELVAGDPYRGLGKSRYFCVSYSNACGLLPLLNEHMHDEE